MSKDFFQKIEDRISKIEFKNRIYLSKHKFLYSLLAATGVVLYWRGIWHTADFLQSLGGIFWLIFSPIGSLILGIVILVFIGLLVQEFIGSEVIISGLKKEKADIDKTEKELKKEEEEIQKERELLEEIYDKIENIEEKLENIENAENIEIENAEENNFDNLAKR